MKKRRLMWMSVLVAAHVFAQSTANLNPPYPRIAMDYFQSPASKTSQGTKIKQLAGFDMVIMYGGVDAEGDVLLPILRAQNPGQIILAMGVNGMDINGPAQFMLCSSYRAVLTKSIVPGQSTVRVNTMTGYDKAVTYQYIKIGTDIIKVNSIPNDSTFNVSTSGIEAINVAHAAGDTVTHIYRALGSGYRPYFSEYCPVVDGDQVWDYMAKKNFVREIDWTLNQFDGFFHDYFMLKFNVASSNYDFDYNGLDDRTEHGTDWMSAQWKYGYDKLVVAETDMMKSLAPSMPNLFSVNTGGSLYDYYDRCNGHMFEGYQRFSTWKYIHWDAVSWMEKGVKPSVIFFFDYIPENHFFNGKNRFDQMRFGLSHSMITECYYGLSAGDTYNYFFWYDEYETNMGYPTSGIQTLNGEEFMLLRYFDNGCVLCNGTGKNMTISASQLSGGPYYRLKAGQAPDVNNGELFTGTLELPGYNYGNHNLRGDGILLFKQPTTVVSDIIVDNFFVNATSPGSDAVRLVGNWVKKSATGFNNFTQNNPYWAQSGTGTKINIPGYDVDGANGVFDENYGYHACLAGNGESTATYIPTIGVPGWYEVSEWHGWHGDTPSSANEATNVPFELGVSGQIRIRGIINQSINYGQWNRLGYINLPRGKEGFLRISNKANNVVIADAMRFHYMGDTYVPDSIPPESPKNVQVR
jgi:hypothetical protein